MHVRLAVEEYMLDTGNNGRMSELPAPTGISTWLGHQRSSNNKGSLRVHCNFGIQQSVVYQQGPNYLCPLEPIPFSSQAIVEQSLAQDIVLYVLA
jgi:hypothetical protein